MGLYRTLVSNLKSIFFTSPTIGRPGRFSQKPCLNILGDKQTNKKRVLGVWSPCVKTEKIVTQLKFISIDRSLHKNQEYVVHLCGYLLADQQNDRKIPMKSETSYFSKLLCRKV